jgi:hypothetical protein
MAAASQLLSRVRAWQILLVALLLRLPLIALRPPVVYTENLKAGLTLAQHGYLGDPFVIPTGPTAHVSPAYPALVAAIRSITPSDAVCLHILAIIMSVVSSCNIAALLPVARALKLPAGAGTVAALLWLLPSFAWIEMSAEHETPLTVAALLALVTLLVRTLDKGPPAVAGGAGLGLAAGALAHVTPTVLPVAALVTAVGARAARCRVKHLVPALAAAIVAFALAILPYTLRNHHTFGKWFFIRDNFGIELAMSNSAGARPTEEENGAADGTLRHHPFNSPAAAALVRDLGEVEYNQELRQAAIAWIKLNPGKFLGLVARRLGYMVLPQSPRWYQRALAGSISLMAIAGCVLLWRSRYRVGIHCLAAAIVGYLLVYVLIEHDIRYMYPALFLESLIAGSFVVVLARRARTGPRTRLRRGESGAPAVKGC